MTPAELEARVGRKIALRILPFVMLLYFVSFLDRVNAGFAALSMNREIGLTPAAFGFGGGIFFLGYVLFEVPSNLILHRVGARVWIARILMSWGLVSAASALARGPVSFCVLRFLLGSAEAGFFPGIILYLSLWFPARQRAAAVAVFMAAAPLSTAIGSPISGALMELPRFAGLDNWQLLYIVEALPAILLGFVVLKALTDRPEQARWLSAEERDWLTATLRAEESARSGRPGHTADLRRAMLDPRILVLSLVYVGSSASIYALGLWTPLMLGQFGFSPLETGWISAAPGAAAVLLMIWWARRSDRSGERHWHVVLPSLAASLGFLWAGEAQAAIGLLLALLLANAGLNAAKPPLWAIPSAFLSGAGAAAGIAVINSIGNLGGFAGPFLIGWLKGRSGGYRPGLDAVGALLGLSALLVLVLLRPAGADASAA